jgi:plasmid replication initiation protein
MANITTFRQNDWLQFQPNTLTNARYNYSAVAKNVIYTMVNELQKWQTHEKEPQRDLFGNIEIGLDVAAIAKGTNYGEVWKAIEKELMVRPIGYTYKNEDGEIVEVKTVLVPTMSRVRGRGKITIILVPASIPVLLFLGQGFTAYSKTIAMSLPSIYSKRLYELCCRFRDTGFYRTTIADFRQLMNCDEKFRQIGQLRDYVIEKAVKDINELSELHISYQFVKGKRIGQTPAKVEQVIFFIVPKKEDRQYYFENYRVVFNVLAGIYDDSIAMSIADWLMDNKRIVAASERLEDIRKEIKEGEIKKHGAHNYLLPVLQGLGVPVDLLPAPAKKAAKNARKKKN